MRRFVKILLLGLMTAVFLCAAVIPSSDRSASVFATQCGGERALSLLRGCYRDSSQIVYATCVVSFSSPSGTSTSRFRVSRVIEGDLAVGETISISEKASVGEQYLLYLTSGAGANYAEDIAEFALVTNGLVPVVNGSVEYDGVRLSIETVEADIAEQDAVLTVPAQSFYYNSFDELMGACDSVFIGKVVSIGEPVSTVCRSTEKGESVQSTVTIRNVTVSVINGLESTLSSGDIITLVLPSSQLHSVINASDLSAVVTGSEPELPAEDEAYLFFLDRSTDDKSECFFTVNPYQGYVRLCGNTIVVPIYNRAMLDCRDLFKFISMADELNRF